MNFDKSQLRALLAAATPGPWYVVTDDGGDGDSLTPDYDAQGASVSAKPNEHGWCTDSLCHGYGISVANAQLIVAAINALPNLLARLDELENSQSTNKPGESK